jgi:hypothetical protein
LDQGIVSGHRQIAWPGRLAPRLGGRLPGRDEQSPTY